MKDAICTIITGNYAHYALALHDSLLQFKNDFDYAIFISSGTVNENLKDIIKQKNIIIYAENDFQNNQIAENLKEKYQLSYHDAYRWGMKPVFLSKLLNSGYDRVIYLDCDLFFFNDYNFLFDKLDETKLLLSPHWRCSDPLIDLTNFRHNFLDGIFNGGFVGVSKGSDEILNYWANLCLFNCEVNRSEGFYVDQRYLDILPTRFEGVSHITHKGCNVANWNIIDCKRVKQSNGEVLINDRFPIIFIHFTNSLFQGAYNWKDDELLIPYIKIYRDAIMKYYPNDIIVEFLEKGIKVKSRTELKVEKKQSNLLKRKFGRIKKKLKQFITFKN